MIFGKPSTRSTRQVLADKAGMSMMESLGSVALVMILAASLSLYITGNMRAVSTVATKAERQALVTSLVGDKREGSTWGTPEAPSTEVVTLENGRDVEVTMWRDISGVGTSLTAVTAISAGPDAADCTGPNDVERVGCVYATRFHAKDLNSIEPQVIIRKDPSTVANPVGTVDARVATEDSMPQGVTFASGADSATTVWRYLINARSIETTGEIRVSQGSKTLAVLPVDATSSNYFGTFTATVDAPVTASISQGNIVVQTVYIYRAGGTS